MQAQPAFTKRKEWSQKKRSVVLLTFIFIKFLFFKGGGNLPLLAEGFGEVLETKHLPDRVSP